MSVYVSSFQSRSAKDRLPQHYLHEPTALSVRKVLGTEPWLRISLLLNNMSSRQFGLMGPVQQPLYRARASQTASLTFSQDLAARR